ncbi:MAG TPA: LytTR family transcriptional regulator DNA-binding domain-containing protein [Bacteroidales bacterium]|nr:LytTR family transcriptional regulator DNA-binding domain-containing protein [Bacteroidales bacterium]
MAFYLDTKERSVTHVKNQPELWLRSNRRIKKVNPDEIIYCEYSDGCISVMLQDGSMIRAYNFLSRLENKLEEAQFFRIHRNKLVNLKQIKKIDRKTKRIQLKGNLVLKIAPGRLEKLEMTRSNSKFLKNVRSS